MPPDVGNFENEAAEPPVEGLFAAEEKETAGNEVMDAGLHFLGAMFD